jgi:hypothetical protein
MKTKLNYNKGDTQMGIIEERIEMQWLSGINWKCATHETESYFIHIYFYSSMTNKPSFFSSEYKLLNEAKRQTIGNGTSVNFHRDHSGLNDRDKDHLHFMYKKNKLFAVNRDGTGHDGNHGYRIPNDEFGYIKAKYPDFNINNNQIIERLENEYPTTSSDLLYLIEKQGN